MSGQTDWLLPGYLAHWSPAANLFYRAWRIGKFDNWYASVKSRLLHRNAKSRLAFPLTISDALYPRQAFPGLHTGSIMELWDGKVVVIYPNAGTMGTVSASSQQPCIAFRMFTVGILTPR